MSCQALGACLSNVNTLLVGRLRRQKMAVIQRKMRAQRAYSEPVPHYSDGLLGSGALMDPIVAGLSFLTFPELRRMAASARSNRSHPSNRPASSRRVATRRNAAIEVEVAAPGAAR
jgi:hypothetical protein